MIESKHKRIVENETRYKKLDRLIKEINIKITIENTNEKSDEMTKNSQKSEKTDENIKISVKKLKNNEKSVIKCKKTPENIEKSLETANK